MEKMNNKTTKAKSLQTCSFSVKFILLQSRKMVLFQKDKHERVMRNQMKWKPLALHPHKPRGTQLSSGEDRNTMKLRTQLFRF